MVIKNIMENLAGVVVNLQQMKEYECEVCNMPAIDYSDIFHELNKPKIEKNAERLALAQLLYYFPDMFKNGQRVWGFEYKEDMDGFLYIGVAPSQRQRHLITAADYRKYLNESEIE